MSNRWNFYKQNIIKYFDTNSKLLVIGASEYEVKIFSQLNYKNVTFGFYDKDELIEFKKKNSFDLFNFEIIDCRNINYGNSSFDHTFTNATIHHIDLPHLAITELIRVAKFSTLIIEGNDSLIMRLACKFRFSEDFELSAIQNDSGGVLNSNVPNYVYRWTEREIMKLLNSYDPKFVYKQSFNYSYDFKNQSLEQKLPKKIIKKILGSLLSIFFTIFKKQGNLLSIFVEKRGIKRQF